MKVNYKLLSLFCIFTWVVFVIFLVIDSMKIFGFEDIGVVESLEVSGFARGMFVDIGILSATFAGWIAFGNKEKFRYFFAIASLFLGSIAVLPFLAIYFWKKYKEIC